MRRNREQITDAELRQIFNGSKPVSSMRLLDLGDPAHESLFSRFQRSKFHAWSDGYYFRMNEEGERIAQKAVMPPP